MKYKTLYISLILTFAINLGYSQEISLKKEFSWNQMEKKDSTFIKKFIELTPNEFGYYKQNREYTPTLEDLKNDLHIIDLNNDDLNDIVFDGESGGEPREISIFLNTGLNFKKVFTDYQGILKIEFFDNVLSKLNITDWGCCAEFVVENRFYNVEEKNEELVFKLNSTFKLINKTKIPEIFWNKTKTIKTLNDSYNLRFAPIIDDTTDVYIDGEPTKGNVIGKIPKNTIAKAMADSIDKTGRIWFFIAILPETEINDTYFYHVPGELNSYYCGWISSRYVEIK